MTRLTIRAAAPDLEDRLLKLAEEKGWTLDQAALYLLRRGAGLPETVSEQTTAAEMAEFIGTWSQAEQEAFDARVEEACEVIDEPIWE